MTPELDKWFTNSTGRRNGDIQAQERRPLPRGQVVRQVEPVSVDAYRNGGGAIATYETAVPPRRHQILLQTGAGEYSSSFMLPLWMILRAGAVKERIMRRLAPSRMNFVPYSWPLLPDICPCDVHFCDYLRERNVTKKAIFHFGTGGHHLVGLRNRDDALDNEILAVTASPREHARYVKKVVRDPSLGRQYKVLFADIYDFVDRSLPAFDVVTLFHLCEFGPVGGHRRRMDDITLLDLFRSKLVPGGRLLFYEGSDGRRGAESIIERAVADGKMLFEERYKSLLIYRV